MHCRATKVLGSRMQHGNAQPTAAHALQGKRNAWVVGCDEDNAQPTAAYAPQRKQNAWTVGCDEDNAQPAAAYALQSNEGLGQSDATRQCAAHSGARTARETKCLGCRMRRKQRAAHSDCKATKFLGSRKQPCNAQPTAAHALQRYEILLIDPWLTHDARSCPLWHSQFGYVTWYLYYQKNEISVATRQRLLKKKKSWINKNLCMSSTAGFRKWHNKSSPWNCQKMNMNS